MVRPALRSAFSVRRDRADAHHLGLDAGEAVATPAAWRSAGPARRRRPRRRAGGGGAVVEAGRVAGGDPAVRAERGLQRGQLLQRWCPARRLVGGGQAPALLGVAGRHRRPGRAGSCRRRTPWRSSAATRRPNASARSLVIAGKPVVQVLRGRAHHQRGRVDQLLGEDPRVGVDALAHRVPAHVLDPAGDRHVVGAEGDAAGDRGDRGHRAGAHPVDRVAGHGLGQPGQQRGGAADGQALVADLGGGGDGDLVDPLGRQLRVAAQQLADAADDQVVGAGLGVHAAGLAERGADAVDEDDVADGTGHSEPPAERTDMYRGRNATRR